MRARPGLPLQPARQGDRARDSLPRLTRGGRRRITRYAERIPAASRTEPYTVFNFIVEIDGIAAAAFSSASGLESETAVIEYRTGAGPTTTHKLPGLTKYANIVLKRGLTRDLSLWNWRQAVVNGKPERRSGTIILLDESGQPVLRWNFVRGWPAKWEGPALNAKASEVAIETLEIAHEGLELEAS